MSSQKKPLILLAGGDEDPNLLRLEETLRTRGCNYYYLKSGRKTHPWMSWDMTSDRLLAEGREIRPQAAFVRSDVFAFLADNRAASRQRAYAWHTAVMAWIIAHEDVRYLNRASFNTATNKPHALHVARQCGLHIPSTTVSNHLDGLPDFLPGRGKIVKPINGGGHTQRLSDLIDSTETRQQGAAAAPAIVQEELIQPEYRVYRVADQFFGFKVETEALDYRVKQDVQVSPWADVPDDLVRGLRKLTDRMGLHYSAADFKTDARSGELKFLEVNSGPMFAAFDRAGDGCLTNAMVDYLQG